MERGDTFYFKREVDDHLQIILSDPRIDPEAVLIVNSTTSDHYRDNSCILLPGDHNCITRRSTIYYRNPICSTLANLRNGKNGGLITLQSPLRKDVYEKVLRGAAISKFLDKRYRALLIDQGLIG